MSETNVNTTNIPPIPEALLPGWVSVHSKTHQGFVYYFHQDTGECRWDRPVDVTASVDLNLVQGVLQELGSKSQSLSNKRHADAASGTAGDLSKDKSKTKRSRTAASPGSTKDGPKSVRVLHILKKHAGSRRPSSWRRAKITDTKEKATEDLTVLIEMLKEAEQSEELRETFEVLAKTESDCSSAKRGGDLKEFTRGKMQPEFEKAAFALNIGEMSGVVETQSGVHVILRIPNK